MTMPVLDLADPSPELGAKLQALRDLIDSLDRVVVAYSGGVDSALVLKIAHEQLGARARAFTARSPSMMQRELEEAIALARTLGVEHEVVESHELDRPGYVANAPDRCYHCKSELFDVTGLAARRFSGAVVLDGFNFDDLSDYRPGHRAAAEHGVRHPLAEVGLRKREIRTISKELGLSTWKKPQLACMASRIPYGTTVTPERLSRVEQVENALRDLGFFDLRARLVRENDDLVRIEVGEAELPRMVDPAVRKTLLEAAKKAGFRFVTLDLEGFRSGRMNESLGLVQIGSKTA